MSPWLVYWVLMLDKIQEAASVILMLSFMSAMILIIILVVTFGDDDALTPCLKKTIKNVLGILVSICCFFSLILIFVPATKEAAAIYIIPKITANKDIQQLPVNIVKYANQYIFDELKPT